MLSSTTFVVLALIAMAWLLVTVVILAVCRMAARSDAEAAQSPALAQSPRRPSTWGTVRSRILRSPQSDQLATYK
jgi:hypothetical protein